VGSEIFSRTPGGAVVADDEWAARLDAGWRREACAAAAASLYPELRPQVASEQRRHKLSYKLSPAAAAAAPEAAAAGEAGASASTSGVAEQPAVARLRAVLAAGGLAAKVVFSGGEDVDILAAGAGKGAALAFVLSRLAAAGGRPDAVLAAGDSGNDAELMDLPGVRGVVVANAQRELLAHVAGRPPVAAADGGGGDGSANVGAVFLAPFLATQPCSAGIVEALQVFGLVPPPPPAALDARGLLAAAVAALPAIEAALDAAASAAADGVAADGVAIPAPPELFVDGATFIAASGCVAMLRAAVAWPATAAGGASEGDAVLCDGGPSQPDFPGRVDSATGLTSLGGHSVSGVSSIDGGGASAAAGANGGAAAAAPPAAWVDGIALEPAGALGAPDGGALLATFGVQRLSPGGARDAARGAMCSALLLPCAGAPHGGLLRSLQVGPLSPRRSFPARLLAAP